MPAIHRSVTVPYSAAEMYALVNDIARYQEFIPWCVASVIDSSDDNSICATLTFSAKGIQKSFSTRNTLTHNQKMEMTLINGPFKSLQGCWKFLDSGEKQCDVILDLSFELSNKMLAVMFGPMFHEVASTLMDAFIQRARETYD
ncbi:MAG: ubiquinone-binding protein [Gammaproteobacteria bacterium RIFCSPLOWO2_02_FULL_42_14]|nr:MAG: ubiquinone-binding protein [Gammaproteobacteria bacterium RIFCSPHIGHO2_02_FULL_42_43]OGT28075.1 MAG: ubiquinone-binding protein [Gammaproteobacteria bacterium RIFCSPHIGHO2_01_FULL_42_8]OGT52561.1 MAG: ubiquinone-binding protein [Gammaproteobacteria bacterium RIFCSPHIGHO2_12_FULL_41_25]OGT63159.1 MAG: ubiquinone-binding protein [Gammaproteobacteria bacterium RIFCSPLOWO2_02_FULL_42_14]OGT86659.1 MAG: ubiquinone-binding protein [Gammaproteobacteria bacterium RIFCSPLOWO2_12_FULL_42_18]